MKRFILILAISLWASATYAANWYVDNAVNTSGNGQSWATAWKNFSNITGVKSGDTIYISGGTTSKTYSEQLTLGGGGGYTIKTGGAASSPDPKHSGTVIIDSRTAYGIYINANNVTVDGNVGGARKFKILNSDRGIGSDMPHTGLIIRYVEATGNMYGIYFLDSMGEIDHNYVHDMNLAIADGGIDALYHSCAGATFDWVHIHDNIIEVPKQSSGGMGADGMQITCGTSIYNNTVKSVSSAYTGNQHGDAMQTSGPYFKIYSNEIAGFPNQGLYLEFTNNHALVYNNYFYNCRGSVYIGARGANLDEIRVDNNTVVDFNGGAIPAVFFNNTGYLITNSSIRNNIIINNNGGAIQVNTTSTCGKDILIDNNVTVSGSQGYNGVTCNGVSYTQPTYSSTTQPTFVSYTEFAGANNNMKLAPTDTIAKDHGATLSTWFTIDKDRITRPQGTAWDIGAFEFFGRRLASPSLNTIN
jgi:hypothetical protein